ncbi:hypothetical protein Tco_0596920 [Tanacetum coccineum]
MSAAQPEKPKATIISSSYTISSAKFTNKFLNKHTDVNLSEILKDLGEYKVQSMVDVPIKQVTPAALRHLLIDSTVTLNLKITTDSSSQPPPTQPKRIKKVVEMSKFDIQAAIDKSVESHLKQIELPKGIPNFKKIKLEKAAKQNVPKTSWNNTTTAIYDQKSRLYRMIEEVKAFNNHPTYKDLDDHDKDPSPNADKDSKKRQKKLDSYKDDKDEAGSSKQGKSSSKPSKSNKPIDADEVNLLSLFEMIKTGTPCLETTSFNYDLAVISEVPISKPNQDNSMLDNRVQEMYYSEQPTLDPASDIEITSDSNIISYNQYLKETKSEAFQNTASTE